MLCALSAACVGKYASEPTAEQASAESIAKKGRYSIMQALTPGASNQPVPGTFYYVNSPLGSTAVMLDSSGAALLRLEYFPDGKVNSAASQGDYIATHTFGQKEFDKELDAYYNAFRYYDADTMSFMTPDAIKESSDFLVHNVYAYTRNNPVNYTDPSGFVTMRHDGGGGPDRPAIGSRVGHGGSMQIDGPTGPRAAPRARQTSIVARRPTNPVRTDRFNRGPDGGPSVRALPRRIAIPWRDYNPADSTRGYGGYHVERRIVTPWRDYNPADGTRGYAGISDLAEEELRVDRIFHHVIWEPNLYSEGRPLTDAEKELYAPYIPQSALDAARVRTYTPLWLVGFDGVTLGNYIHIRAGLYDPNDVNGIALLGHELEHVAQYHEGMSRLDYAAASVPAGYPKHPYPYLIWNPRKAYKDNRYEREAYNVGNQIRIDLCARRPEC